MSVEEDAKRTGIGYATVKGRVSVVTEAVPESRDLTDQVDEVPDAVTHETHDDENYSSHKQKAFIGSNLPQIHGQLKCAIRPPIVDGWIGRAFCGNPGLYK
jgi:hypothetical protein